MKKLMILTGMFLSAAVFVNIPDALSDSNAEAIFKAKCSECHSIDIPLSERKDKNGWKEIIQRMRGNGAQLTDKEAEIIIDYLSKKRGLK
jgi:cytochrome c2